jgi:pyruvate dehydrogenase E2 component (dihydrolipoamide acetyltransferase)
MSQEIRMPAFSASMTEGTLLSWTKRVGDRVEPGEVIAEIETDKATAELEAEHGGILAEIVVPAGTENVSVGQVIAVLQSAELRLLRAPAPATAPTPAGDAAPTPVPAQGRDAAATPVPARGRDAAATPLARRMAVHAGVDLAALSGSGLGGRIRKADVEAALGGAFSAAAVAPTMPRILVAPSAPGAAPPFHELPHTRIRRSIAKRLSAAKREIPHFYLRVECRVDALLACRKRLAAAAPDVKLSLNDFVIRAAALALRETPEANVSWGEDALRVYDRVDVCVAVATDAGLVTPVLRDADAKGLAQIGREMRELATRARAGRLAPHELDGGTFSISNLGMYGVESLNAILNPPQACILGVGAALEKPVVVEGALAVGTVMVCTLSCDHRAIDGAVAARLLAGVQKRLEDPSVMLL